MILDIIVLVILLISTVIAFIRGFIREVLTIFGVGGALVASYLGGPHLVPIVQGWLGVDPEKKGEDAARLFDIVPYADVAIVLAYAGTFIVVAILLSLFAHWIAEKAKSIGLGPVDRTLGALFGLVRGALVLGLLYMPIYLYLPSNAPKDEKAEQERAKGHTSGLADILGHYLEGSKSRFYLEATSQWIFAHMPETMVVSMDKQAKAVQNSDLARQKLQELNLLGGGKEKAEQAAHGSTDTQQGYGSDFRDEMNRLIENEDAKARSAADEERDRMQRQQNSTQQYKDNQ